MIVISDNDKFYTTKKYQDNVKTWRRAQPKTPFFKFGKRLGVKVLSEGVELTNATDAFYLPNEDAEYLRDFLNAAYPEFIDPIPTAYHKPTRHITMKWDEDGERKVRKDSEGLSTFDFLDGLPVSVKYDSAKTLFRKGQQIYAPRLDSDNVMHLSRQKPYDPNDFRVEQKEEE